MCGLFLFLDLFFNRQNCPSNPILKFWKRWLREVQRSDFPFLLGISLTYQMVFFDKFYVDLNA